MKRAHEVLVVVAISLASAIPSSFAQSPQELKRTVKPGVETMITVHSNANRPHAGQVNCTQGSLAKIEIVTPPKNGEVFTRTTPDKGTNCPNEIQGTGIFYKPKDGFTGTDSFTYNRTDAGVRAVSSKQPQGVRNVTITVR